MKAVEVLVGLNLIIFFIVLAIPPEFTYENLLFSLENLLELKLHVLITALFIHINLQHLLANSFLLFIFGDMVEDIFGWKKFLASFFLSGVISFLLSLLLYPGDFFFAGCSASIFSMMALITLLRPLQVRISLPHAIVLGRRKIDYEIIEKRTSLQGIFLLVVALVYIIVSLIVVYVGIEEEMAHASHIIGFVFGIGLGMYWSKDWKRYVELACIILTLFFLAIYIVGAFSCIFEFKPVCQTFEEIWNRSIGLASSIFDFFIGKIARITQ
jgi:rhomboid protease GluP